MNSAFLNLVNQLVKVDIIGKYKRSFIGVLWLILLPILNMLLWALLHDVGVINPGVSAIPYAAYVLLSTSIWTFFMQNFRLASTLHSTYGKAMVMVNFPPGAVIYSYIIIQYVMMITPFLLMLVLMNYFELELSWKLIFFLPSLLPLQLMGMILGLFNSIFKIIALDLSKIMEFMMQILMFLTPIVYTPDIKEGTLSGIINYNPLTYLVGFSRDLLFDKPSSYTEMYMIISIVVVLFFVIFLYYFIKATPTILERLVNN